MTAPAPEKIGIDTFREGPTGALLFGGPTGAPTFVLLNLLTGTSPDVLLDAMGGTIRPRDGPAGRPARTARSVIDLRDGPDLLLRVDPATKLLSAIELKIDPAQWPRAAARPDALDRAVRLDGRRHLDAAPRRSLVRLRRPQGFTPTPDLKARPGEPRPGPKYAVEETIGKPAPDFTLTLLDGPGKTRTVTNATSPARSSSSTSGRPGAAPASSSCPRSRSSSTITTGRRKTCSSSR